MLPSTEYRSNRLVVVTRYFQVTGVLGLVLWGGFLAAGALGNEVVRATLSRNPWGPVIGVIQCVSNLLIGEAVWRRKRGGAIMALITFVAPYVLSAFGQRAPMTPLVVTAIGVIAIVTIWPELSRGNL
ncbi:MAG: hypothetical protein ABMA00_00695 [Gemmatimonas sp.]